MHEVSSQNWKFNQPNFRRLVMTVITRENLGDFSSIVCFKAVITGMEDALGERATSISLIAAGRARGKKLAKSLGLSHSSLTDLARIASLLDKAVGKEGTRLTAVNKIEQDGEIIKVYCSETICSAGEEIGSPRKCTFSLGAIQGALEEITGHRLQGKHTESVLRGGQFDVFEFKPLG
jgi:predicted hydrocarbon binding protein